MSRITSKLGALFLLAGASLFAQGINGGSGGIGSDYFVAYCATADCTASDTIYSPRTIETSTWVPSYCAFSIGAAGQGGVAPTGANLIIQVYKNGTAAQTYTLTAGGSAGTTTSVSCGSLSAVQGDILTSAITQVGATLPGRYISLVLSSTNVGVTGPQGPQGMQGPTGGAVPCTTTASSYQYNNSGAIGCVPDVTFDGTHTTTLGASGIADFTAGTLKYGFQAPAFSAAVGTDQLCANTGGTPSCTGTNISTSETAFAHVFTLGSGVPAANRGFYINVGMDAASTGVPNVTILLKACLLANYTTGTAPNCSSGGITLWSSQTNTIGSTGTNQNQGMYQWFIQGQSSANTLTITNTINNGKTIGSGSVNEPSIKSSVPNSGTWVIYMTCTFSAATAGNWMAIAQTWTSGVY